MDVTHTFDINELKCSETGPNYAPQVYVDGSDGDRVVQLWFAARPGTSHDEIHGLIEHMHKLLASFQIQVSANPHPQAKSVGR
jgi:hypothetical protein